MEEEKTSFKGSKGFDSLGLDDGGEIFEVVLLLVEDGDRDLPDLLAFLTRPAKNQGEHKVSIALEMISDSPR